MNRPSPDDMNDIIMAEQRAKIKELEEENKRLTERNRELFDDIIGTNVKCRRLKEENKELKKKLILTENDRDEWKLKAENLWEENNTLKNNLNEVAKELIQHHEEYKNMADMVVELQKENKKLKEELQIYKKQYQHSMWIDE